MNFTEAIVLAVEKVKAWIQSGGVKWDHVSDKPFVKVGGDTLTWDGNTEGLVSVEIAEGVRAYYLSDAVPTVADFANGCVLVMSDGTTQEVSYIEMQALFMNDGCLPSGTPFIIPSDNYKNDGIGEVVFPKAGCWSVVMENDGVLIYMTSLTIPGYTGFAKEQIDPKVLPEALQFGKTTVQGDTLTVDWESLMSDIQAGNAVFDSTEVAVKVSDAVLTEADFANGIVLIDPNGNEFSVSGDELSAIFAEHGFGMGECFFCAPTDNYEIPSVGMSFPEKGVYFTESLISLTIPGYTGFTRTEVKTIDPELLPEGYVVNFTANGDGTYSADKTFAEVQEQIEAGNAVSARLVMGENVYVSTTYFFNKNMGVEFTLMSAIAGVMSLHFGLLPDNTVNITTFTLTATPMGGAS